ncbi:putative signal peptide-containing protein [Cryptosporidium hominis]
MNKHRNFLRKLCSGPILLLIILSLSNSTQVDKGIDFKENLQLKESIFSTGLRIPNYNNHSEICRLCGCDSTKNVNVEGFKSFTCSSCNKSKIQEGDCILQGAINDSNNNKTELVHGLETSVFGDYRSLFFGKSDFLTSRSYRNNLLARIFEPEFTWENFSHGSIKDNCKIYRDENDDYEHYKLSFTYTLHGDQNCTRLLLHFVNKHTGNTLYKNLRPFKEIENDYDLNSLIVFRHDDVKVRVDSLEKVNLHQEFNITSYDSPPKFLFSPEQQEWVPVSLRNQEIIVNPKIIHERLLIIFQLINSQSSIPNCKMDNVKVEVVVQCKYVAFPPNPKYNKDFVQDKLKKIHSKYDDKIFKLFLQKFEEKFMHVLDSIPNAPLTANSNKLIMNTPLSNFSIPCKEAIYLDDIPKLMSKFNYTSKFNELANSSSYYTSTPTFEDIDENKLFDDIEVALNTN